MKQKQTLLLLLILIICSSAFAELKSPKIDTSEKPGQRKLDNVRRGIASSDTDVLTSKAPEKVDIGTLIVKIVFGLLFIIVLIVVLVYLMKKLQGGSFNKLTNGTDIEILEVAPLGQHQKIVSVKIQSKILVLGVTQNTINTLTTLEGIDAQQYLNDAVQTGVTATQFSQTVNQLLSKFKKPEDGSISNKGRH